MYISPQMLLRVLWHRHPTKPALMDSIPTNSLPRVHTTLNFFDARTDPSREFKWTEYEAHPNNTSDPDTHALDIFDLRPLSASERQAQGFTLEKAGFEYLQGWDYADGMKVGKAWDERKWDNPEWITTTYYGWVERLLKEHLKATTVRFFDYTVRKRENPEQVTNVTNGKQPTVPPAGQTHIDQTYWASIERIQNHLGPEALARVQAGRSRAIICNVRRPLQGVVLDSPLTACDYRTMDNARDFQDTLPAPPGCRTGESQMLRYHPEQRWYYLSRMKAEECLLLKCFDSATGVRSPHSAFTDPGTPVDAPGRWSIEVRTISLIDVPK